MFSPLKSVRKPGPGRLLLFFFFISLSVGFSAEAQEATPLDQGKSLYEAMRHAEAESAFREAIAQNANMPEAHLWLGKSLYAQEKNKEAVRAFEQAVKLDKTQVEPYIELAQVYLRMDEKKDARKALEKAEKLDPTNPEIFYLRGMTWGRIRLAMIRRGRVKEEFESRREAFQKAIDLNPDHPDAHFQLGMAYEYATDDREKPLELYAEQASVNPGHIESLKNLIRLVIQTGKFEQGLELFNRMDTRVQTPDDRLIRGFSGQLKACIHHARHEFAQASHNYEAYLTVMDEADPEEAALYRDLALVAAEETAWEYREAEDSRRKAFWTAFWAARDPDPTTAVNERLIEHYRRVMFSRLFFSEGQRPWDRRGEIYIRFGEPDDRQHFLMRSGEEAAENLFPTGNAAVDAIREQNRQQYQMQINTGGAPWSQDPTAARFTRETQGLAFPVESWVYVPFGLELFFSDQMNQGRFDFPVHTTSMPAAGSNFGFTDRLALQMFTYPKQQAEALIKKVPEAYRFDYGGDPLTFVYDIVSFKGADSEPEIEVAYSVPSSQLGSAEDGQGMETWFNGRIALRDSTLQQVKGSRFSLGPIARPLSRRETAQLRTAAFTFEAPPGSYRSAIAIRDSVSRRIGIFEAPFAVTDYTGASLQLSDIRFSSSITETNETGLFVRHGLKIIPYPARMYPQSTPVYLYYEIYNLTSANSGGTAFQTQLEITPREGQRHIVWRLFTALGSLVNRSSDDRSLLLVFEDGGTAKDTYKYTSIDTGESEPGRYTLTLTITDLNSGQKTSRSADFLIVKN